MITIYSKLSCSQCEMTEKILAMRGIAFEVKKLDTDYTLEELDAIKPAYSRAFPFIFKDGDYLGSLPELKRAIAQGEVS